MHDLVDDNTALLRATLSAHSPRLPVEVACALSSAIDELADPMRLPTTRTFAADATDDLRAVLIEVITRLSVESLQTTDVPRCLSIARAARELRWAERALSDIP